MWIKICGITNLDDALAVQRAGADAIGLNFYPRSKRFVPPNIARDIAESLRANVSDSQPVPAIVGVFVNSSPADVATTAHQVRLDAVQFHGDESAEDISEFHQRQPNVQVIRAFRVAAERMDGTLKTIEQLAARIPLKAVLLDAWVPGEFGGTGQTLPRSLVDRYFESSRPRLIVAGGLTPDNVTDVASDSRIFGVDTASGVEDSPGRKDAAKVLKFVQKVRSASSEKS